MKKTDIAAIILIASVCVMIAFAAATNISFLKVNEQGEKVSTVESISSEVSAQPSETVFNKDAINPTVKTVIGGSQ